RLPDAKRIDAKHGAKALADALGNVGLDAINVGVHDVSIGWEAFQQINAEHPLPWVSANLRTSSGEQPLPGWRIAERGGARVAFVGLARADQGAKKLLDEQGLRLVDPEEAYLDVMLSMPADVDAVVLLSNLGIEATSSLVARLHGSRQRVDAVVVSGTNRITGEVQWADGAPMVEAGNQGKRFGRLDLWRRGQGAWAFGNDQPDVSRPLEAYTRAAHAHAKNRKAMHQLRLERMELDEEAAKVEALEASSDASHPKSIEILKRRLAGQREYLDKRIDIATRRLDGSSDSIAAERDNLERARRTEPSGGADYAEVTVVPVKLAIPQDSKVRKVLDRYVK
ncbi:MAG: hypothetical protein AAGI01_02345, partial [Myxococcota bacterium]